MANHLLAFRFILHIIRESFGLCLSGLNKVATAKDLYKSSVNKIAGMYLSTVKYKVDMI